LRIAIVRHDPMTPRDQPLRHKEAHFPESNHPELHRSTFLSTQRKIYSSAARRLRDTSARIAEALAVPMSGICDERAAAQDAHFVPNSFPRASA
jgi:hypothetical protein